MYYYYYYWNHCVCVRKIQNHRSFCDRYRGSRCRVEKAAFCETDALVRLVRDARWVPEAMLLAKHCRKFRRAQCYCFCPGVIQISAPRRLALSVYGRAEFAKLFPVKVGRVDESRRAHIRRKQWRSVRDFQWIPGPVDNGQLSPL